MPRKVVITCESNCDLPQSELERLDVRVRSTYINVKDRTYRDGTELTPSDLFELTKDRHTKATTSAISIHDYEDLFHEFDGQDVEILHLGVASNFSACNSNARIAAEKFSNVRVFDSTTVSAGQALALYRAAELRDQDQTVDQIISSLTEYVNRIHFRCVLDTVDYIRRGGRLSATVALGVEILKIKPEITVQDGKITIGKKYRGNLEKVLTTFIDNNLKGRSDLEKTRLMIPNTLRDKELLKRLQDYAASLCPFEEILLADVGCVVSCHAGPNAFGLAYATL